MAAKPNSKNWNDVQLAIVSIALVTTLLLWNSFAGPDRVKAEARANAEAAQAGNVEIPVTPEMAAVMPTMPQGVIILAEATPTPQPSTTIASNTGKNKGGGGGGGGGGAGGGGGGGGGTGGS